ncbi:ABC transporter permease [Silvimonas soli]|uniref:ABC transporter permease n=1 Tax=Silvimonas soli TaxID=2980100 RepID=UPI0024B34376|nr:ABC transporter permease [Silvimonas soli]
MSASLLFKPGHWISTRDWRALVAPLLFVALWQLASTLGWVNPKLIVSPWAVAQAGWHEVSANGFAHAFGASLARDLGGFVLGSAAGVALGVLLGVSRWADRLLGPTFHTLRQISLFAWIPLISIWLGYTDAARVFFIAVAAFYPVVLATHEGIRSVTRAQLEVARVYRFSYWQSLTRLILPAASPQILNGLHLALIYAWLATIGAEFLLPSFDATGVGATVIRGRAAFRVDVIIVGMLIIGLTGYALNRLAQKLEARLLVWRGPAH